MRTNFPALCESRWIIPDTVSVDALIDTVLYEQAWLVAIGAGKHAHRGVVWAEGTGRPNPKPRRIASPAVATQVMKDEG